MGNLNFSHLCMCWGAQNPICRRNEVCGSVLMSWVCVCEVFAFRWDKGTIHSYIFSTVNEHVEPFSRALGVCSWKSCSTALCPTPSKVVWFWCFQESPLLANWKLWLRGSQEHSNWALAVNAEQTLRNAPASLLQTCWMALLLWPTVQWGSPWSVWALSRLLSAVRLLEENLTLQPFSGLVLHELFNIPDLPWFLQGGTYSCTPAFCPC